MMSVSTLLSLVVAGGVVTAALVLARSARLPRVVRVVAVLLSVYSVSALLYGVSVGASFESLFSGDSFSTALPFFLQGATVGGLIVVPAALLAVVIRLGTRHPHPGTTAHAWYQAVALATTLAIVVTTLPRRTNASNADATTARAVDDPARRLALVDNSLRAIEDGDRLSPRDRWDPAYVVAQVGKDPAALFAWVRGNTLWIPYRGMLRGPVGVLMDRQGNSLDRAVLLARLLETAGHTVRLAHGDLSRTQALDLLPALVARQAAGVTVPVPDLEPAPDVTEVAAQYQLDGESIQRGIDSLEGRVARLAAELQTRVIDQTNRLLSVVTPPDADRGWLVRYQAALDALRDHWWVQREQAGAWSDLDLLAAGDSTSPLAAVQETMAREAVPSALRHEVAVRVVLENWKNGPLAETRVLEHVLRPSELFGQTVVLQFWPRSLPGELNPDPDSAFGLKSVALEQREWTAALLVGHDVAAQAVIYQAADGEAAPATGNPLGGLGGAIVGLARPAQPSSAPVQELTAAWVEYEMRTPGGPGRTVRRVVFDLLGNVARSGRSLPQLALTDEQRITRSLSLMMRSEILATASELAPEFVTHLAAQSLVGNREILRAVARDEIEPGAQATEQLLANAAPAVTPLYSLALARTEWRRVPEAVFADRIQILARHRFPAFARQELVLRDAIDIVANEIGVMLAEPDGFAVRVEQGVLDTNAEALLNPGARGLGNTSDAFKASQTWMALSAARMEARDRLELDADVQWAMAQDVERGYSVIAPMTPVQSGTEHYVGWWRIDSATGDTLGVGANGWGQAMAERGVQYNVLVEYAKTFAFEYAFCQAVPQVANAAVAFLQPYRDELPPWLPPLAIAQDPGAVYSANKKQCLIGAMIATGVTATLPMLLMSLRPTWARLLSRLRPFLRDQRGGIRIPPRWVVRPGSGPIRRQARGGPIVPEAAASSPGTTSPTAKTQADPTKTQYDPGAAPPAPAPKAPGRQPAPASREAAQENLAKTAAAQQAARDESAAAAGEFVRYKVNHPAREGADPSKWDPLVEEALYNDWLQKHQKSIEALNEWREASDAMARAERDAAAAARRAQGKGGFVPPQRSAPPPPQPVGNNNPTGPAGEVQVSVGGGGLSGSPEP